MKSPTPPRPDPPTRTNPLLDRLEPTQRKALLVGLISFFLLAGFSTLLLAYYIFEPEITTLLQKSTPTQTISLIKTPTCEGASLQLGTSSWRLESIARLTDGSVNIPVGTSGVAYWIEDLENNAVFGLSPTQDNLTLLGALQGGEGAIITWENCNTETYLLSAPQTGEPGIEMLISEPTSQLVVYIPGSASSPGEWVQAGLVGETTTSFETAEPGSSVLDAEISLLETTTSADKQTIQISISILNYGSAPITLTESDILLTPEKAAPLVLTHSDPSLPQEIKPRKSKAFTLVFPRPATDTATLKIFTIEYDLEDY
jgi:hypothetical protein